MPDDEQAAASPPPWEKKRQAREAAGDAPPWAKHSSKKTKLLSHSEQCVRAVMLEQWDEAWKWIRLMDGNRIFDKTSTKGAWKNRDN